MKSSGKRIASQICDVPGNLYNVGPIALKTCNRFKRHTLNGLQVDNVRVFKSDAGLKSVRGKKNVTCACRSGCVALDG